ncbi:MAG TPA: hypothetical protein DEG47_32680, partial [Cyanobacteria bacterium UBA11148]|nr:hypothetical protein [Cyanobacteria bacterium UBA11148]
QGGDSQPTLREAAGASISLKMGSGENSDFILPQELVLGFLSCIVDIQVRQWVGSISFPLMESPR